MPCWTLPDEIVTEILSPALKISDESFTNTSAFVSPFASYSQSTSAFLVVCKAWLRVATPLLYNVVVIRSRAQAEALEDTLKSNTPLGAFIKKLRIEGGYGSTMRTILKCSPNIDDFVLSLAIWSSDGVSGLCQGLEFIDPIRLFVHDEDEPGNNKQNIRLTEQLATCLQTWTRLKVVDLPYYDDEPEFGSSTRRTIIYNALKTAPSLEELRIPFPISIDLSDFLNQFRQNPSLKRVKIKSSFMPETGRAMEKMIRDEKMINDDPTLKGFVYFSDPKSDLHVEDDAQTLNPRFVPMEFATQAEQDKIWAHILYFAINVPELDKGVFSDVHTLEKASDFDVCDENEMRFSLMRVSKRFKRLATPYLYRHVSLEYEGELACFATTIRENPALAKYVRSFSVDKLATRAVPVFSFLDIEDWSDEGTVGPEAGETLLPLIQLFDNLVSFVGGDCNMEEYPPQARMPEDTVTIPWDIFLTLGNVAGGTVRRLYCFEIAAPPQIQSPLVWKPFVALRSLEWDCMVQFSLGSDTLLPPEALANLECVTLASYHPSILDVFERAELPSLRRIFFHTDIATSARGFFAKHGRKLSEVMLSFCDSGTVNLLDVCPDLPLLVCRETDMDDDSRLVVTMPSIFLLTPSKPHLRLAKILLDVVTVSRKEEKIVCKLLGAIDPALFPALREIQMHGFRWPTNERDISKSLLVQAAEHLLENNIKMTDDNGIQWKPRLKTVRR
ncbi:hypothetical protein GGX14DRAFT_664369 [Mycena pura]|uniref:Uncharacterized protein n=1 Tax=Mycena pura TaxID=153505 RepID=A0AAD6YLB0_9AGAR|nr:hypothetical protein GGX14DRAFT_664369 [Mycena pura]